VVPPLLPLQANCKPASPNTSTAKIPISQRRLRAVPNPKPRNVSPVIGSIAAYHVRNFCSRPVVTGRAVVVSVNVLEIALVLVSVSGFVEKVHPAPVGTPAEHDSETASGKKLV
jgi:hypothetical protein